MAVGTGDSSARSIRVLMVARLFHPWIGGTERQAHKLARAMLDLGIDVRIVTGWWFRGTPRTEILDGVPVYRNHTLWEFFGIRGLRKFGGYLYILSLMVYLWKHRANYDVIHVHGLNYHTFASVLAARRVTKPVVVKLANSGPASDILKMQEDRQLALSRFMLPTALTCDRFVALNAEVVAELTAAGVPRSRIVELPNGVETSKTPRADYRIGDRACVLYVGRLHYQKGLDTLLEAFARLVRTYTAADLTLRLVGEGPAKGSLTALAEKLGIASRVDFAGSHDDVTLDLQTADVFVLPSRAEGISNALLEAMAWGVPPVVSDVPGNRDVVRHNDTGLLAAVDDPDALASSLKLVLEGADLRESLGKAARQATEDNYSIGSVARRYKSLFEALDRETRPVRALAGEGGTTT